LEYFRLTEANGYYLHKRREQSRYWMYETINEGLKNRFFEDTHIQGQLKKYEEMVMNGEIGSFTAASELLKIYNSK
ncbi:MAG: methylmalonyl Co-A mutase-associated GTPase MeaB, partial [Bacteroidales bacterium]|nr:methylmalonyl Co-A mutase-associated GTPase MeaB [Bacteroidales bacterium]